MNNVRIIGIVQARTTSERLPGKVLAPLVGDEPMLSVILRRLSSANIEWWIATTHGSSDNEISRIGRESGLHVFRGDEADVLSRFVAISKRLRPDWVVRATADDPFTDGEIVTRLIETAMRSPVDVDLIADLPPNRQFPLGYVPQIVRGSALLRVDSEIPDDQGYHRSHVTSFLIPERAKPFSDSDLPARPHWRWTVDTAEDLSMARRVFAALKEDWRDATYACLVELLDSRPDLTSMNANVSQKPIESG